MHQRLDSAPVDVGQGGWVLAGESMQPVDALEHLFYPRYRPAEGIGSAASQCDPGVEHRPVGPEPLDNRLAVRERSIESRRHGRASRQVGHDP